MNPTTSNRVQRQQAIQERMLRNRNLLGKADSQEGQQRNIL